MCRRSATAPPGCAPPGAPRNYYSQLIRGACNRDHLKDRQVAHRKRTTHSTTELTLKHRRAELCRQAAEVEVPHAVLQRLVKVACTLRPPSEP